MATEASAKSFGELEAQLEKAGRAEELLKAYESRARAVADAGESARLLAKAGVVAQARLGNAQRAEVLFRRALAYEPLNVAALEGLRAVYEARQDAGSLAPVLERLSSTLAAPEAAHTLLLACDIYEGRLGRRDRAILCSQKASLAHPVERRAYRRARELLALEMRHSAVLDCLDRECEVLGKEGLADDYLAFAQGLVDDPYAHGLALKAIARVASWGGHEARVRQLQVDIEALSAKWREKVRTIKAASVDERDKKTAARLSLQVAKLYAFYEPDGHTRRQEALDRCLALWPAMPEVFRFLELRAGRDGSPTGLVEQLLKACEGTKDKTAQADILVRAGMVRLAQINDTPGARELFVRAAALDPTRADAVGLATEMLIEAGDAAQAVALLEAHERQLVGDARTAVSLRLADWKQARLGDERGAQATLEQALAASPGQADAAFRLAQLLAARGDIEGLWALTETALFAPRPAAERVGLAEHVAQLFFKANDPLKAFRALSSVFPLVPARPGLFATLNEWAQRAGATDEWIEVVRQAALASPGDGAASTWKHLAQLLSQAGKRSQAHAAWQEVARLTPSDVDATQALKALADVATSAQATSGDALSSEVARLEASSPVSNALLDAYRRVVAAAPEDAVTWSKLHALALKLVKADDALSAAERLAQIAPTEADRREWKIKAAAASIGRPEKHEAAAEILLHMAAQDVAVPHLESMLEKLLSAGVRPLEISAVLAPRYAQRGDAQREASVLATLLHAAQGAEARLPLLSRLARLSEDKLVDARAAFDLRLQGLKLAPDVPEFRLEAVRLARELGAHGELVRACTELASQATNEALAISLLDDAATVAERAGAIDDAVQTLRTALGRRPDDFGLLARLGQVLENAHRYADVEGVWGRLAEVGPTDQKAAFRVRQATAFERTDQPAQAAKALKAALDAGAAEEELLPKLAAFLGAAGAAEERAQVVTRLATLLEAKGDARGAASVRWSAAKEGAARAANPNEALQFFAEVLAKVPDDGAALEAVEGFLDHESTKGRAAEILAEAHAAAGNVRRQVEALRLMGTAASLREAATLQDTVLGAPDDAYLSLAQSLRLEPAHPEAMVQAAPLAKAAGLIEEHVDLLEELARSQAGESAAALFLEAALLSENELNQDGRALDDANAAAALAPSNMAALAYGGHLLEKQKAWPELVKNLGARAQLVQGDERSSLLRLRAQVEEQGVGDESAALETYRLAASNGADVSAHIVRLAEKLGRHAELAEELSRAWERNRETPASESVGLRLATLRQASGDEAGALEILIDVLKAAPASVPARDAILTVVRNNAPLGRRAFDALEACLSESGDHEARLGLREARYALADVSERATLALQIRSLQENELKRPEAAFMSALKAFTDGVDREALQPELERLARVTGSIDDVAEVYESTAQELGKGDSAAAGLWARAAGLREASGNVSGAIADLSAALDCGANPAFEAQLSRLYESQGDGQRAFSVRARLWAEAPANEEHREALERLTAGTGAWEELAGVYEDQVERVSDATLQGVLWMRIAELYEDKLKGFEGAARAYSALCELEPNESRWVDRLLRTYRRLDLPREISRVMQRRIGLEADPAQRAKLLYELASLCEERLGDPSTAAQCYRTILDKDPDAAPAERALLACLEKLGEPLALADGLAAAARRAVVRGDSSGAADLLAPLGRLKLTTLNDARGALEALREALRIQPGHPATLEALELMAHSDNSEKAEAGQILEPIFEAGGDHAKLVESLEAQVSAQPDGPARSALLVRVANLYADKMGNAEMAFLAAARALRESPSNADALALCRRLVAQADARDEFVALLEELGDNANDVGSRLVLHRELAKAFSATPNESAEALGAWRKVLADAPQDEEGLTAVEALLRQQGRGAELLDVLKRQYAVAEDAPRRFSLLAQMGQLQQDELKDLPAALSTFRKALELRPDDEGLLERIDELSEKQERWPELADVLTRRLQTAAGDSSVELAFRLAQVKELRLLDRAAASQLYQQILARNPRHAPTLARVEVLTAKEPQNLALVGALLGAYRGGGDVAKLAQLLETRVSVSGDAGERKQLLRELASLRQAQDENELAYLALWRAFKEDPNDVALREELEAAAHAAGTYDELVGALEEAIPRIAESSEAARVCIRLGTLLETKLNEPERAIELFERARKLSPEGALPALVSLDRLYGQEGSWAEQASVLESLSQVSPDVADKVAYGFRLGQVAAEKLSRADQAAGAFEAVLALDDKHLASARMLEPIYEEAKAFDKLYRVLEIQARLVSGPERDRVVGRMAAVSAEGDKDLSHSIALYRELLEKNPRNEAAFSAMEALLERAEQFEELEALLKSRVATSVDVRELVRLNEKLGRLYLDRFKKPDAAVPFFKAALERDARHRGSLEALRDISETLGQSEDLVIVLRRLLPLQEDSQGVRSVRVRLAEGLASLNRREEALDAGRRALEIEPQSVPELERTFQVFVKLKAWADAARALEFKAEALLATEDRDAAVATYRQMARLWVDSAQKPESAGHAFEKILEVDPANRAAYEDALKLYASVNDWRAYAQAMDRYLPNIVTDDEKIAALRELARVQEVKLGQKDVAFLQLCRALPLNPADDALRDAAERLAQDTGSHDELASVYEEVADGLPRGPLAEKMYLRLAHIQDERLDDVKEAESSLRKVLEFDPTSEAALDALASLYSRRGRDKDYVGALEQKLDGTAAVDQRKTILKEMARVFAGTLHNVPDAIGALNRALELDPDADTLERLVALHRSQADFSAVANTLVRMRDLAPSAEERARLQVEIATVYDRDLRDSEAAVEGFRVALEFDPRNATALESLERLYSALDRPAELLQVYERQLDLSPDFRDRVKILFKSAAIWEDRYQNLGNADTCIAHVLAVDPQNVAAVRALERLRRAQGRWEELIGVVDRHIQLVADPTEKAQLCVDMGDVFYQHLKQVDRAAEAYHQALELNAKCRPAMHALGDLYEKSGNWPFALEMLEREARAAGDSPDAVELWYRMGKINEDMLLDAGSAKRAYQEGLRIDPSYVPSIRALKGIYSIEKDSGAYEEALKQEAKATDDPLAKSRAFIEVARYHLDSKDDREGALAAFEEALRLDAQSLDAARPLADLYVAKEMYDRAEDMLGIVVAQLAASTSRGGDEDGAIARDLCRQHYRLGYVCEKQGKRDKALESYEQAYRLDATYLPALEGYGNLLVQVGRLDDALKIYQAILLHHRDDLSDLEVVEIYATLGELHQRLGQVERAQNHFEKALQLDGNHEASLRGMVLIADQAGAVDKSASWRQRLVGVLDGDAKFEAAVDLGKLARGKLADAFVAIDAYSAAQKIRPDALDVLDALYALFRQTKQGAKAADVLERMLSTSALKADPQKTKKVQFALGEICRDDLNDVDRAVTAFNAALDIDWRFIEAFAALEGMLGQKKLWKKLEGNYRKMIERFPKGPETHGPRMALWKALADLYYRVMKQPDIALEAYKVVAAGLPDDAPAQEGFAELAAQTPGQEAAALEAYRRAVAGTQNPGKVVSAIAELSAKLKEYDSAFLAAQIGTGLIGESGPAEREILTKLTPYAKKREAFTKPMTDRLWHGHVFHPKARGPVMEIFTMIFEQAGHLYKEDMARYQLNAKKHLIDVAAAQEYQIHHFRSVARVLGMEQVSVYSPFLVVTRERMAKKTAEPAPEPMVGIEVCHTHPVCLKVGGKFFSETGQKESYYALGRALALIRPELVMATRVSAERLETILQATLVLVLGQYTPTVDPTALEMELRALEKSLAGPVRASLARMAKDYVSKATPNDVRHYVEGAELTAMRAGALMAGDVEVIKKMVAAETGAAYRVQPRSKVRDLMVFAMGGDWHALRVALGTSVEIAVKK